MKKNKIAAMAVTTILALSMMLSACGSKGDAESSKIDTESSATVQEDSKTKDESSKTKDESSKTNAKDESSKTSSKDESSKTTESSKTASSESSKTNNESSKPTQGGNAGNSGSTGSTGSVDSKPTSGGSTGGGSTGGSTTQGCSHNWVPQTTTVHHDAATHTEQVQTGTKTVEDTPAWDENVEVGEKYYILFGDGNTYYSQNETPSSEDMDYVMHYCNEHGVGYSVRTEPIYETVHHEAITHEEPVYETKTVTDQAAYDEQVITGYKCSKCGASK